MCDIFKRKTSCCAYLTMESFTNVSVENSDTYQLSSNTNPKYWEEKKWDD